MIIHPLFIARAHFFEKAIDKYLLLCYIIITNERGAVKWIE